MKKKILVYPCGTEIGLEIYKAVSKSIHYELYGGSSGLDHGCYVYERHIDDLPFITDFTTEKEIEEFEKKIEKYNFDFIYPAMDGVLTVFSKYRHILSPIVIAPEYETAILTRSKQKTYKLLKDKIPVPYVYDYKRENMEFPVFMKPDIGQGSNGTRIIKNENELYGVEDVCNQFLIMEYLPGKEYTIDCYTNQDGKLLFWQGRERRRIKFVGVS